MTHMLSPSPVLPEGNVPWERLGRLLAGELTVDEEAHLLSWLAADPVRAQLAMELREVWAVTEPGNPSRDPEQVLEAIRRRDALPVTDLASRRRFVVVPPAPSLTLARRAVRGILAAAAIGCVALGGWWVAREIGPLNRSSVASAVVEHRTGRGQRLALRLPDGTAVVLGPQSVLRYPAAAYGARARRVELTGDGFFDVVHDETRPFMVVARNAVARDVGTRFAVRARQDEAWVRVAVEEGRVALSTVGGAAADSVLLDSHAVGQLDTAGRVTVRRGVSLGSYVGWSEGRLVFEAAPLAMVAAELGRWYDVDIRLEGAGLAERSLTAEFHGEPITKVLPMVQASLDLKLKADGRHYVLSAR